MDKYLEIWTRKTPCCSLIENRLLRMKEIILQITSELLEESFNITQCRINFMLIYYFVKFHDTYFSYRLYCYVYLRSIRSPDNGRSILN